MQRRDQASRRPFGTDGSDFNYRMVVDPRYTRVAEGKSRLQKLIIVQAVIQILGILSTFLMPPKEDFIRVAILSIITGSLSLIIGELGRKHSKSIFLKIYVVGSSVAALLSAACVASNGTVLEVVRDPSGWTTKKFELIESGRVVLSVFLEILAITTTISLVKNMSPPKRAS